MQTTDGIITDLQKRMAGAIASYKHSLAGLRVGRASASLLDPIKAEVYGNITPINQLGTISATDARLLTIQIWDKSAVKPVEKAIINSGLGLNPLTDGLSIRIPIPDLSNERRKELTKKASEYAEQAKIAIRNVRRDSIEDLKKLEKEKKISEDELKSYTSNVQKITDSHITQIGELVEQKSQEIMNI